MTLLQEIKQIIKEDGSVLVTRGAECKQFANTKEAYEYAMEAPEGTTIELF